MNTSASCNVDPMTPESARPAISVGILDGDFSGEERTLADAPQHNPRPIDVCLLLQRPHGRDAVLHLVRERARVVDRTIDHRAAAGIRGNAASFIAEEADADGASCSRYWLYTRTRTPGRIPQLAILRRCFSGLHEHEDRMGPRCIRQRQPSDHRVPVL